MHGVADRLDARPPEVGTAATPSGRGDWLLAADGGTFTFGNSHLYGSAASVSSSPPVVSMTVRVHRSADRPMSIGALTDPCPSER